MDFELRFTDKEITAWGGMGLMKRMLDHMQFGAALSFVQVCPNPALTFMNLGDAQDDERNLRVQVPG
jgi:hypothetical protein